MDELRDPVRSSEMCGTHDGSILDRFIQPTLLVDEDRRIIWRNAAASRYLAGAALLADRLGALTIVNRTDDESLGIELRSLRLPSKHLRGRSPRALLRLRHDGPLPVLVFLQALVPASAAIAACDRSRVLVIVHDPRRPRRFDPQVVREAFELTPAEARVAIGLAQGLSVTDLADHHRVSVHTLRAQVRSVMLKLGTGRQSDIVRILAGLPCVVADAEEWHECHVPGQ